jgi:hypothetical protein
MYGWTAGVVVFSTAESIGSDGLPRWLTAWFAVSAHCSHRGLPNSVANVVFTRQLKRTRSRDVNKCITFIKAFTGV